MLYIPVSVVQPYNVDVSRQFSVYLSDAYVRVGTPAPVRVVA